MRPVLEAVAVSGAELLFFPLFQPEGNHLLLAARETPALANVTLMSDGSLIDNSFIEAVGDAAIGMYFVGPTPPAPNDAVRDLERRYREKYGAVPPTAYYLNAFDAANILFDAMERATVMSRGGELSIGRQALRDALLRTRDYPGITERLTCDEFGDCATPRFNVLRLRDPGRGVAGLMDNVVFTYEGRKGHE